MILGTRFQLILFHSNQAHSNLDTQYFQISTLYFQNFAFLTVLMQLEAFLSMKVAMFIQLNLLKISFIEKE